MQSIANLYPVALPQRMRYFPSFRHPAALPLAFCTLLATLSTGAATLSAKDDAPLRLLNAEMPRGTILENATCPETVYATRQAVRKNPGQAAAILQRAIGSRVAPGDRERARDDKDVVLPCECLTRIVQAALESAPASKTHELIEMAMAAQPQCAEDINDLLKKPRIDGKDAKDGPGTASNNRDGRNGPYHSSDGSTSGRNGDGGVSGNDFGDRLIGGGNDATELGTFGSGVGGLGNSFPGSPGFIGSTPGGASIFPPVVLAPLTSVVNR